jgi:hypothetical protein
MAIFPLGVLGGVIAVLSLDTVGSFASQRWTFPYTRLAPISCLLWATAAAIASRAGHPDLIKSIGLGALAGFIVGLVDSTLGWWISSQLGAGRLPPQLFIRDKIVRIIFRVTIIAAGIGAAGALLSFVVGSIQKIGRGDWSKVSDSSTE